MKVTTIIVVPHVHWDREWYFTTEESQLLASKDFLEILDFLEEHPDYPSFVIDGQTSILEEYLAIRPDDRQRVSDLVKAGRLKVGPFYTQTDEMLAGGEAIVRNLLYGTKSARRFGAVMEIGYVPDSFGQSAQMPFILNQFGIRRSVFWRGQSQFCGTDASQFWWKSQDGSKVLVNQLPLGYAVGKYLPEDSEGLHRRLDSFFGLIDEISPTPYAVLPNGHDQMPIQKNIDAVLAGLAQAFPDRTFMLGSLDDELDLIEAYASDHSLPEVSGEFLHGKRERVHRSIYSVRMDNKIAAAEAENMMVHHMEPLLAMGRQLGLDVPRSLEREPWKLLLESQAHDSLGGCCSDKVNRAIGARLESANEHARVLCDYMERSIVEASCTKGTDKLGLFNYLPVSAERLVTAAVVSRTGCFRLMDNSGTEVAYEALSAERIPAGIVDRQIEAAGSYDPYVRTTIRFRRVLPSFGYEVLQVVECNALRGTAAMQHLEHDLETDFYRIVLNQNGTIDLQCKDDGIWYRSLLSLLIEGNDGDEYDFSPLPGGQHLISAETVSCVPVCRETPTSYLVDIAYVFSMPASLQDWQKISDARSVPLDVKIELDIDKRSPLIDVRAVLVCQADDYRVRLQFPVGAEMPYSAADNQFSSIERPVYDPGMEVWKEEGWSERPDGIYPFLDYVALSNGRKSLAVFTKSAREYEVTGREHSILEVTLLSGVGRLGKPDLARRPGRPSGIMAETPEAQCHGTHMLHLGLACGSSVSDGSEIAFLAEAWLSPANAFQRFECVPINLSKPAVELPPSMSMFCQRNRKLVVSAIKRPESGSGIVLRFINPTNSMQQLQLDGMKIVSYLSMDESPRTGNGMVGPHGVMTVLVRADDMDGGGSC
jgi:mannosylglycerate hydrolase